MSLNGSFKHYEYILRAVRGRQKVMRVTIKGFQSNTVWASGTASLQCRLQKMALNCYLPYMHAPLQRYVEVLLIKRWKFCVFFFFFFSTLYIQTWPCSLVWPMNVNKCDTSRDLTKSSFCTCLKIGEFRANKAELAC